MHIVCLDLEGVLVPEIWIAFAEAVGIPDLKKTTRDEPDYDKLMQYRLDILARNKLKLNDIQKVIASLNPLEGAAEFMTALREKTQVVILSDTFSQFAKPLMAKLNWPTLFCNDLVIGSGGSVEGYKLRQKDGKKKAVQAFHSINMKVMASGDSYNDLSMILEADTGALFRAPESIATQHPEVPLFNTYCELLTAVDKFLAE